MYTHNEQQALHTITRKLEALRCYLNEGSLPETDDIDGWFEFVATFSHLQGNISNDQSFLATLLAKRFLQARFPIRSFDAAEKPQGAPGLDIDIRTDDGRRIIGEIKTTVPYAIERGDLGAQQKTTFRKDFTKLNKAPADHKFFFVTNRDTYQIMLKRYASEIPGVEIVLLSKK